MKRMGSWSRTDQDAETDRRDMKRWPHKELTPICLNIKEFGSLCPEFNVGSWSHPRDPACRNYHLSDLGDSLAPAKVEG